MRFGVLGNAKIARTQVIPAILEAGYPVTTIGSRGPANPWPGAPTMQWTSYEGVIADPAVDAVYIALPNHLHAHWSVAALRAGKHVLCEKPYALTTEEAAAIRDAMTASGRCFMEGFMVRHHPQWQWLATQPLGDVRQVQVVFNYDNQNPDNIRNHPDMGGGGLWDIGCYAVFAGHWLLGRAPDTCGLHVERHPEWGVDIHSQGWLRWDATATTNSVCLQFAVSMQTAKSQSVHVAGTTGWAHLHAPVNTSVPGKYIVTYSLTDKYGYTSMVERIVNVIENENPIIILKGENPSIKYIGYSFEDPGVFVCRSIGKI